MDWRFFMPALTLLFAAGKIFGALDWSWWLVFLPLFVQLGLALVILAFFGIVVLVAHNSGRKK